MLKNIISGRGGGECNPQTPMARGQPIFIKLIVRELLYCPKPKIENASSFLCFTIGVFIHMNFLNFKSELFKVSYKSLLFEYVYNINFKWNSI